MYLIGKIVTINKLIKFELKNYKNNRIKKIKPVMKY